MISYPPDFIHYKEQKKKIFMLTAYDTCIASLIIDAGVDAILVGDSLGNVIAGLESSVPVSLEQQLYHTTLVSRGAKQTCVITDMPFLSYHCGKDDAVTHAGRLIKEGGAKAVKCELLPALMPTIKHLIDCGIPVMGHLGLTPQYHSQLGGFKKQGLTQQQQQYTLDLAIEAQKIGCFSLVLESLDEQLAKKITSQCSIPTIGIGAGKYCDGAILVSYDLFGFTEGPKSFNIPSHDGKGFIKNCINDFKKKHS